MPARSSSRPYLALALLASTTLASGAVTWADDPAASNASPSPAADTTDTPAYRNTIRWSTASEVDNFGYYVYRSESAEGPFERLNADPILGAGTTDEPRAYSYADETIDPHKAYFYYVESVSLDGIKERFTPVTRARPKLGEPKADPSPSPEPSPAASSSAQSRALPMASSWRSASQT